MLSSINPRTCRVALLAGGTSGEREISLASGESVRTALAEAGFSVTVFDTACKDDLKSLVEENFDVAFICLHGRNGEDGAAQGLLEILRIPYTGSGVCASALAMDKACAKLCYEREGIPTPMSVIVESATDFDAEAVFATVGGRCVAKPIAEGSTLGISVADSVSDLKRGVELAFEKDRKVLVERFVKGREFTVAVLGNDDPRALPVIEIVPKSGFYDYEAKYTQGGSQHICPASLSDSETAMVQDLAERAHKALGCRGVSRSDFILDDEGCFWILETNTVPGMTSTSLLPDAARVAGMSFPELCTRMVELALEEHSA